MWKYSPVPTAQSPALTSLPTSSSFHKRRSECVYMKVPQVAQQSCLQGPLLPSQLKFGFPSGLGRRWTWERGLCMASKPAQTILQGLPGSWLPKAWSRPKGHRPFALQILDPWIGGGQGRRDSEDPLKCKPLAQVWGWYHLWDRMDDRDMCWFQTENLILELWHSFIYKPLNTLKVSWAPGQLVYFFWISLLISFELVWSVT